MSATSSTGRAMATPERHRAWSDIRRSAEHASRGCTEQVYGTWGSAQMSRAQVQIRGGGFDASMTEQHLHAADVGAGLRHVRGEGVA